MNMKTVRNLFQILLPAILISLLLGIYGCDRDADKKAAVEEHILVVPVRVKQVPFSDFTTYVKATGRLRAVDDVLVKSEVSGVIVEVPLDEGDRVRKDQLLSRVDEEAYRYNYEEAKAAFQLAQIELRKMKKLVRPQELKARKAALESAEASYQKALKDWERIQRLYQQEIVSRELYDLNRSKMEVAEARRKEAQENYELAIEGARQEDIQMAQASADQAQARMRLAEKKLGDCRITSPISGKVARVLVEKGDTIAVGAPIANVVNTRKLEVEVGVVQEDVIYLNEGTPASLFVNVYPGRRFNGIITYAGIKADQKEGAFPVIIEVENNDDMLRPGMITTVRIPKQKVSGALVVPRDAVVERGNALFVFTVMDGVAHQKQVTLGAMQDQEVVILSGLEKGEKVVVQGQEVLQNNTRVTVQGSEM